MDLRKIGIFFKELRKEKNLTQEQFAELLGVSVRTISRWETGSNMPDLDLLIQIADYSSEEKKRLTKRMHFLFLAGVGAFMIYIILYMMGLAESGYTESISSLALGFSFGTLIIGAIYTSRYISKIKAFKMRLLKHHE